MGNKNIYSFTMIVPQHVIIKLIHLDWIGVDKHVYLY